MVKYIGNESYAHNGKPRTGILLSNLGTPDAPTTPAVRKYLAEFLSDTRVIEWPPALWWFVLHGIILRTRPRRSAEAYAKVWTDEGSPLLCIAKKQAALIKDSLGKEYGDDVVVDLAMRYGSPSIKSVLDRMREANVQRLLVLPLYPQYSATTTASTIDAVCAELSHWRFQPELRTINHYHDFPPYIDAIAESIRGHWAEFGRPEKLLFSYHGLPQKYFMAGDPYFCHCQKTTRLVIEKLGLKQGEWEISFQSRLGPQEWLKPYTDFTLKEWGAAGIRSVQVISPGFSADCLETLEEINLQNREFFVEAGGEEFSYIPALNDHELHISALVELVKHHLQGWPGASEISEEMLTKTQERARAAGSEQ